MIAREPRTTQNVVLRPMRPEDVPAVVRWRTDPVAARFCGWDHPENAPARLEGRYLPAVMDPEGADAWHFIVEMEGGPVGVASYDHLDLHHRSCRVDILLGDRAAWGRGVGPRALQRLLNLLFEACGLHRVWLVVNAENQRAIRCFRRVGFREEGVERGAERWEGRWADRLRMSLLCDAWRHRTDAVWTCDPLRPQDAAWFAAMGDDAGCEPDEAEYAMRHDEVLVWRCDGERAGCAALAWRPREVEIHILGVDPAFRREGVATRILHAIRDRARDRGVRRLRLLTSNDNAPAIRLYQKAGFHMAALYPGRPERRRGFERAGKDGLPIRDDIEMVWDV